MSATGGVVAAVLAVDPVGLGGAVLRGAAGPAREAWLRGFRALLPPDAPWRRLPPGITEGRLIGGLDLAATLAAGRPVAERGLLADADGGMIVAPMAERLAASVSGPIAAALDTRTVQLERDGMAASAVARFGLVLMDEGVGDEHAPAALIERLAFSLDLDAARDAARGEWEGEAAFDAVAVAAARDRLSGVTIGDAMIAALCGAGLALGVFSLRVTTFAARTAKAAAALDGRLAVEADDVALAAALVMAPRATRIPAAESDPGHENRADLEDDPHDDPSPPAPDAGDSAPDGGAETAAMTDQVIEAAKAAIPAGLLDALSLTGAATRTRIAGGRRGAPSQPARRGRPAGVRRGMPGHGARLALVETLRAAAPWQAMRRRATGAAADRILVRRDDFRITRFKQKAETATIFVVDASGSSALNRLAEVKGAVELILAECYVRRDSVALIAFRGTGAAVILPRTRSLTRAKRALAGQPGGGGTPLATAIDAAALLADSIRRTGPRPLAVFLTDGRANVTRAGRPGRAEAEADALAAARTVRAGGLACLVVDTSPRPNPAAARLAAAMGARYQPLPHADARLLSDVVRAGSVG